MQTIQIDTGPGQSLLPSATALRASAIDIAGVGTPVPSAALLRGQKTVSIEHHGEIYRLRLTRLGKLILTK